MQLLLYFQRNEWILLMLLLMFCNISCGKDCGEPPDVAEAKPDLKGKNRPYRVGTTITYNCFPGYYHHGENTAYCVLKDKTSIWLPPNMSCEPVQCGDPGYVRNGRQLTHVYIFGRNVTYVCNPGYELTDERGPTGKEEYTMWCLPSGLWDKSVPTCNKVICPYLENPENGNVVYTERTYRAKAQYTCDEGFLLKGPEERKCQENKTWSELQPSCTEITCPTPVLPGGQIYNILGDDNKVGSLVIYSCGRGNQRTVKCLNSGVWSRDAPICAVESSVSTSVVSSISLSVPTPRPAVTKQTSVNTSNGKGVKQVPFGVIIGGLVGYVFCVSVFVGGAIYLF